jgi:hypothetical protein
MYNNMYFISEFISLHEPTTEDFKKAQGKPFSPVILIYKFINYK